MVEVGEKNPLKLNLMTSDLTPEQHRSKLRQDLLQGPVEMPSTHVFRYLFPDIVMQDWLFRNLIKIEHTHLKDTSRKDSPVYTFYRFTLLDDSEL